MAPCRKHTLKGGCYGCKEAPKKHKRRPFLAHPNPPFPSSSHILTSPHTESSLPHIHTHSDTHPLTQPPTHAHTHTHTPISYRAFYLLDLINNQVDIIYDYDASILILKHVDLIVHHAPPPWSSSSLTAVWVHHQEVGSYYEQGPGLSKGLNTRLNIDESSAWTLSSTSTPMSRSGQGLFGGCDLGLRYLVALLRIFRNDG
ncbi:hypothetical protein V8E36_001849 [Tilletia maclaganii]